LGLALEVGEKRSTEEVRMDSNLDSQGFEYGIGCEASLLKTSEEGLIGCELTILKLPKISICEQR
jgi:hypothetical protein